jgi:hypothetical protein
MLVGLRSLNLLILVRIRRELRIIKLAVRRVKVHLRLLELRTKRDFQIIIKLFQREMVHQLQVFGQKDWVQYSRVRLEKPIIQTN